MINTGLKVFVFTLYLGFTGRRSSSFMPLPRYQIRITWLPLIIWFISKRRFVALEIPFQRDIFFLIRLSLFRKQYQTLGVYFNLYLAFSL